MNNKYKKIIKLTSISLSLILLIIICVLLISFNKANYEEMNTPVHIVPTSEKVSPDNNTPKPQPKPVTRDENNIPKSDYKVPEIG